MLNSLRLMEGAIITNQRFAYALGRRGLQLVFAAAVILILNACTTLRSYQGTTLMRLQAETEIDAPIARVFAFVSDVANDHLWRTEVVKISLDSPLLVGATITEIVAIGVVSDYRTRAVVTEISRPTRLRVEAPAIHPRRFIGERSFERLSATRTRMTYLLLADTRIVSDLWPYPLPLGAARIYYEARMNIYLARLKNLLETPQSASR